MADQPDYLTPDTYVADPQAMRSSGKSRTLAVVLAVVAGPLGLLYWSPRLAGVLLVVSVATLGLGLVVTWPWAVVQAAFGTPDAGRTIESPHIIQ